MEPINVLFLSSMIFSGKEICVVKKSIPPPVHADKEILRKTLL
jgi:hypothetical protein